MRIYLAAPFFTPSQLELVKYVEDTLVWFKTSYPEKEIRVYSPRLGNGVITEMTREERLKMSPTIFRSNVDEIKRANLVFAVVDDRDPGVIWEMGYAYGIGVPIVSFTDKGYGLNVMVKECVTAHVKGREELSEFFTTYVENGLSACRAKFSNFDPAAS